jgi:DNA-binding transcriptional MerR regulator
LRDSIGTTQRTVTEISGEIKTDLTIDELAQSVDMTVRNLREWRTLGLLPAPEKRGRVGYYGPEVVSRVKWIQQLHGQGFTLELISRLLDASDGSSEDVMRLASALRAPFREEDAPPVDLLDLAKRWGTVNPSKLKRAEELGLIRRRGAGRYEFTSARVARVGEALSELGLSLQETLDATAAMRAHADSIAELFEQVWMRHIWQPFVEAGLPPERLPELQQTLREVQPLATDAVLGLFSVAMEARIEQGIAREIARVAQRGPATGGS